MLKFMWQCKGPRVSKKQFWGEKKMNKAGELIFLISKLTVKLQ